MIARRIMDIKRAIFVGLFFKPFLNRRSGHLCRLKDDHGFTSTRYDINGVLALDGDVTHGTFRASPRFRDARCARPAC